jgi:FAD/FMN-containing dehydrogenase
MVNLAAFYTGLADKPAREAWVSDFESVLQQGDTGAYANFMGEEGRTRLRNAYPGATWDRLTAVKTRYDPTNLFHLNHNIPPAT